MSCQKNKMKSKQHKLERDIAELKRQLDFQERMLLTLHEVTQIQGKALESVCEFMTMQNNFNESISEEEEDEDEADWWKNS